MVSLNGPEAGAQPVTIVEQPEDKIVLENSWTSLAVQASGGVTGYHWYRNGSLVATGTNQLVLPLTTLADADRYYVAIENYGVTVTSRVALLSVQAATPDSVWLERSFRPVAAEGMPVPGFGAHTFANWGASGSLPALTYRAGKVHFVAGTTAGGQGLFRWSEEGTSTLIFTNTLRPGGGLVGSVASPTDEGAGQINFSAGSGLYAYAHAGGVFSVVDTNTLAPHRPGAHLASPGSFGRREGSVLIHASVVDGSGTAAGAGLYFYNGTTLTRIADETTDLPGAMTGYVGMPSLNSVNFDGTTIVFSTISALVAGAPGGFYRASTDGVVTKLADYMDSRPGGTLKFSGFSDLDVDGEYVFGVANNTAWRFAADGSATNMGPATFVSAAGPRVAYYGNTTLLRRWVDGANQSVLQIGRVLGGKQISHILAVDGQGDDLAVLVKFTDATSGIFVVSGPAATTMAPVITREPLDVDVIRNGSVTLPVSAAGSQPLRYQWRRHGIDMPGETNSTLALAGVTSADEGGYSVVIENPFGTTTSRTAMLTTVVPFRPVIAQQPSAPVLYYGSNVTFRVVASGAEPLSYQWFRRTGGIDTAIAGGTGASLKLDDLNATHRASYFVTVSNAGGETTSAPVTVGSLLPWITQSPQATSGSVGGSALLTVTALGAPPITYQWYKYPAPITALPEQTNATLTLSPLTLGHAGPYAVRVTTPDGNLVSATAEVTVSSSSPPTAPVLGPPLLVAGNFVFNVPTQAGFVYHIQSKQQLEGGDWITEQAVNGDGATKTISVGAGGPQKFWRVVVLP
jgi:hypothetical protein